jgi:hypothetical protein
MVNLEKNQQMEFEDFKPEPPQLELERIDCQYCEDVGPCMYCNRGKTEAAEIIKLNKAKLKSKKAA